MKLKLAVIGKDVSKSVSPEIHSFIAQKTGNSVEYVKISFPEDEFEERIHGILRDFDGFNVTIPYKLSVIPHLNGLEGDAKVFGAVNTVVCKTLSGYNTDGLGFALMLKNGRVKVKGKKVLLLGAGGAGRSVAKTLVSLGAEVFVYDKIYQNVLGLKEEFGITPVREITNGQYFAVINATGVGMHKTEGLSPVGEELLAGCKVAIDLIYTPQESAFLTIAKTLGKKIMNGEGMLFYQAYYSECVYFGTEPSAKQAKKLFKAFKKEVKI